VNKPNKQETQQLESLGRQLARLAASTDSLYRRMVINGRGKEYTVFARTVSEELAKLADKVSRFNGEERT
jgi:hypothetical protein